MDINFKVKEFGVGYRAILMIEGESFQSGTLFDTMEAANDYITKLGNKCANKTVISEARNEELAYRLVRKKASNILESCTNQELGQYVRGVVDMQSEIYGEILNK